ncbi:hypothetical protein KIPB_007223, partial [Kipferlia bialata]
SETEDSDSTAMPTRTLLLSSTMDKQRERERAPLTTIREEDRERERERENGERERETERERERAGPRRCVVIDAADAVRGTMSVNPRLGIETVTALDTERGVVLAKDRERERERDKGRDPEQPLLDLEKFTIIANIAPALVPNVVDSLAGPRFNRRVAHVTSALSRHDSIAVSLVRATRIQMEATKTRRNTPLVECKTLPGALGSGSHETSKRVQREREKGKERRRDLEHETPCVVVVVVDEHNVSGVSAPPGSLQSPPTGTGNRLPLLSSVYLAAPSAGLGMDGASVQSPYPRYAAYVSGRKALSRLLDTFAESPFLLISILPLMVHCLQTTLFLCVIPVVSMVASLVIGSLYRYDYSPDVLPHTPVHGDPIRYPVSYPALGVGVIIVFNVVYLRLLAGKEKEGDREREREREREIRGASKDRPRDGDVRFRGRRDLLIQSCHYGNHIQRAASFKRLLGYCVTVVLVCVLCSLPAYKYMPVLEPGTVTLSLSTKPASYVSSSFLCLAPFLGAVMVMGLSVRTLSIASVVGLSAMIPQLWGYVTRPKSMSPAEREKERERERLALKEKYHSGKTLVMTITTV